MTASIGARIAYYRHLRGMSARALAEKCGELGLPLARTVITKLERGMREHVSITELLVFAKALDVAPVQLILPVGLEDTAEIVPGVASEPWRAVWWIAGRDTPGDEQDDVNFLPLFYEHDEAWETYLTARLELAHSADPGLAAAVRRARDEVRRIRQNIRELGLVPPQLPAEFASIDEDTP